MKRQHLRLVLSICLLMLLMLSFAAVAGAQNTPEIRGERPFLGIRLEDSPDGIVIQEVLPESPAAAADLQVDDILTAVNGEAVATAREAVRALQGLNPGDAVTLDVTRGDENLTLEATLGSLRDAEIDMGMPMLPGMRGDFGMGMMMPTNGSLGVAFEMLTSEVATELDVNVTDGAVVREVREDSPASDAGLQVDDIITAVNGEPVDAERTLRDRLFAYEPDDVVALTVLRAGETIDLEATLGEPLLPNWLGILEGRMPHGEMEPLVEPSATPNV